MHEGDPRGKERWLLPCLEIPPVVNISSWRQADCSKNIEHKKAFRAVGSWEHATDTCKNCTCDNTGKYEDALGT